jgi:lipoate-protein ligase A
VTGSWSVERLTGSATELHSKDLPDPVERAVWILDATAPALVLGSTQPWIDAAGIEVCRRRSGGGAVLVRPHEVLWIDVLLPRDDPLWDDDVARAAHWLGETWRDALGVGVVHTGRMIRTFWSSAICFAGVGPGEVLVDGAKVVGISQRRTRAGARFQCAVMRTWDPSELARIFAPGEWREVAHLLDHVAAGIADLLALEAAFLTSLTSR